MHSLLLVWHILVRNQLTIQLTVAAKCAAVIMAVTVTVAVTPIVVVAVVVFYPLNILEYDSCKCLLMS